MKTFDFVVYGNNTGALVSALELAKKHKVAIINPTTNWGAHFAGININNSNYDIGMNYFEFTTFHKKASDILTYNPRVRNDSARFFDLVESYITNKIDCVEVSNIEVLTNSIFAKDIIMANNLDILQKLPIQIVQKIKSELEEILKNGNRKLHASQKKINEPLFLKTSYFDVSIANHGKTFHDLFIEPFCKKIFNMSSKDCPALFHRIAWAPLFYPETLLQGIEGKDDMTPTLFHYPKKGYFAAITEAIFEEVKSNINITLLSNKLISLKKNEKYELCIENEIILGNHLVWCSDLLSLLQIAKIDVPDLMMEKASVTLAFCETESGNLKRNFSALYVCDSGPVYRITNQEYSAKISNSKSIKLVFEFNFDTLNEYGFTTNEQIIEYLNRFLLENNILNKPLMGEDIVIKVLKNAVNMPTLNNFNNYEKLSNLTKENLSDVKLVGPALGLVTTSFNDQVIQALKIGNKYN